MSLLKANSVQIGQSATATNNFTLSVPSSPDGTIKLARGNSGATTADVLSVNASGAITGATISGATINSSTLNGGSITLGTAQNSTGGTAIDFTGIPSWAKRVIIILNGVGISGTSGICAQIGSGSIDTSGYTGSSMVVGSGLSTAGLVASGNWPLSASWDSNAYRVSGNIIITNVSSNIWVLSFCYGHTNGTARVGWGGGSKTISGTLDRIRIGSGNATDTFSAGSINIMYEG